MKNIFSLFFILFLLTTQLNAQDLTALNGYKYVYLAPLEYQDGQTDRWGMRKMVKDYLTKSGFKLIESAEFRPSDVTDPCDVLTCAINHTSKAYEASSDYVTVTFVNCGNEKVLESVGKTGALVMSFQQGYNKATRQAMQRFEGFRYKYEESKSYWKLASKNLPPMEIIDETEESIRKYLTDSKIDHIEGVYKTYQGNPTYRIGIKKYGYQYKGIIIESESPTWQAKEVKAYFEKTSKPNVFSVKWFMGNKTKHETFGYIDENDMLVVELPKEDGTKEETYFIKLFPESSGERKRESANSVLSTGSGVVIGKKGLIATNFHVIEGSDSLLVTFPDSKIEFLAKVVVKDKTNDVAILKIEDKKFVEFGNLPYELTTKFDVGEKVFTIGYPLTDIMGENYKLTDGIISSSTGFNDDVRFIQTSTPIQPGNSGGPLFNSEGNIVGLTTASIDGSAAGVSIQNVNYAIKSAYLKNLYHLLPEAEELKNDGSLKNKEIKEQVKVLKPFVCLIKAY